MTLANKRKVIEVLLCTADHRAETMDEMIDDDIDNGEVWFDRDAVMQAQVVADDVLRDLADPPLTREDWSEVYDEAAITAAYRLIESSPMLIREWFGRGGRS